VRENLRDNDGRRSGEVVASLQAFMFSCSGKFLDFGFLAPVIKASRRSNFSVVPCQKINPACIARFPLPKSVSSWSLYVLLLFSFALICHLNSIGKLSSR